MYTKITKDRRYVFDDEGNCEIQSLRNPVDKVFIKNDRILVETVGPMGILQGYHQVTFRITKFSGDRREDILSSLDRRHIRKSCENSEIIISAEW
ncbi:Hypothetical protein HVR_LOCUS755 [uncultured virus]|nr:Hypothetical protein HVR_LOCUS755 [uncultured virus]